MLKLTAVLATVALAAGAGTAFADSGHDRGRHDGNDNARVLKSDVFGSMPDGPVLFGVKPGGAPWVIGKGEAEARRDGSVKVEVEGLVIPTPPQNGTNPLNGIAATVYCGATAVGTTKAYAFSAGGDARFEARVAKKLPSPCFAPAVLLNPAPNGAVNTAVYIAATGDVARTQHRPLLHNGAVLFTPASHEPLTDRGWDEAWVLAQIGLIVEEALAAVSSDGVWPLHPDDDDGGDAYLPTTLYIGAAGVVWALRALGHDRPDLIRGLHARYLADPDWPGTVEPGYLGGEAGILLVAHPREPGAADLLEQVVLRNAGNPTNELLWGAPGTMLAALAMHRATGEPRWADAWRASADELWARWLRSGEGCHLWTQDLYGKTDELIGAAHGFAGNVLSLWLGRELLSAERVDELERRAIATAGARLPGGRHGQLGAERRPARPPRSHPRPVVPRCARRASLPWPRSAPTTRRSARCWTRRAS